MCGEEEKEEEEEVWLLVRFPPPLCSLTHVEEHIRIACELRSTEGEEKKEGVQSAQFSSPQSDGRKKKERETTLEKLLSFFFLLLPFPVRGPQNDAGD